VDFVVHVAWSGELGRRRSHAAEHHYTAGHTPSQPRAGDRPGMQPRTDSGPHRAVWTGIDQRGQPVSSGVYLVQLMTGAGTFRGKAMLIK
jgi:hypothetical protein